MYWPNLDSIWMNLSGCDKSYTVRVFDSGTSTPKLRVVPSKAPACGMTDTFVGQKLKHYDRSGVRKLDGAFPINWKYGKGFVMVSFGWRKTSFCAYQNITCLLKGRPPEFQLQGGIAPRHTSAHNEVAAVVLLQSRPRPNSAKERSQGKTKVKKRSWWLELQWVTLWTIRNKRWSRCHFGILLTPFNGGEGCSCFPCRNC